MLRKILAVIAALALISTGALAEFSTDVDAINRAAQSMVVLEDENGVRLAGAVTGEGIIITDAAVAADPAGWTVWTDAGDSLGIAAVIRSDEATGAALCSLDGEIALPALPVAAGGPLRRGETVTVLGSPLGQVCAVASGTVGAVFEDRGATWIQINAALAGSATGVVMNESGCVVGLLTSAYDGGDGAARGIYYAVSAESLPVTIAEETSAPTPSPTPKPTPEPTEEPPENEWLLCNDGALKFEVTGFLYQRFSTGSRYLNMFATVTNNTGYTIHIYLENASINGVAVDSNGMLSIPDGATFTEDDDKIFFMPLIDGDSNADAQLQDPRTLSFDVRVVVKDTYEELYNYSVTISGPETLAMKTPAPTTAPTAMPYYPYLCKGDEGEDVRALQLRLISLGYLSDDADGVYGGNTAQAVYDFRSQNDLTDAGDMYAADREMQAVLFSTRAKSYTEPYYGLVIPNPSTGQWERLSNDKINFRVQVKNITKTRTIKAFELYMYATDVYGNRIYGSDTVYYDTTTKNVGPGKTVYSDYMTMPDRSRIDKIYVAIKKIVYSDGTVRESYSPEYSNWSIY